ncbi:MAG: putative cytosolic protein [Dehalococcoidia bacterium]|nr:putative cytosolic protein [Dehalococcoidia bacterium]
MNLSKVESAFKKSVCDEIELAQSGISRYIVHTPFTFEDGDHYVVLLKETPDGIVLTDEGHTFMHLSYDVPQFDRGNRRAIIDRVLSAYHVEDAAGELQLHIPAEQYGDALFSFIQAITRITDVTFLTRERVRSTFLDDFQELIKGVAQSHDVAFGYTHPVHDSGKRYSVDARINGTIERQILVFGIANDDQCRDATIILHQWEYWGEAFHSAAIFQDQAQINRVVLARFSDVVGHQFSSIETARGRLAQHPERLVSS